MNNLISWVLCVKSGETKMCTGNPRTRTRQNYPRSASQPWSYSTPCPAYFSTCSNTHTYFSLGPLLISWLVKSGMLGAGKTLKCARQGPKVQNWTKVRKLCPSSKDSLYSLDGHTLTPGFMLRWLPKHYSLIYSSSINTLSLIMVMMNLEPVLGTVGIGGNRPWMGHQSITEHPTHTHTKGQFRVTNSPSGIFFVGGKKPTWTHTQNTRIC